MYLLYGLHSKIYSSSLALSQTVTLYSSLIDRCFHVNLSKTDSWSSLQKPLPAALTNGNDANFIFSFAQSEHLKLFFIFLLDLHCTSNPSKKKSWWFYIEMLLIQNYTTSYHLCCYYCILNHRHQPLTWISNNIQGRLRFYPWLP